MRECDQAARPRSRRGLKPLVVILLGCAAPVSAQRAGENAVTSAADAFGTSVGNEQVGIYNPNLARGFSPVQAGNVRLEGLYFDLQTGPSNRLVAGATMRVGISAQSYPFAAPTGISDYSLRKPGSTALLGTVFGLGPFDAIRVESDGQLPISSRLSIGGGASYARQEFNYGGDETVVDAALIGRWAPTSAIEVVPFVSYATASGAEPLPIYFTAGAFLPPKVEWRRYFGPEWAQGRSTGLNYGMITRVEAGGWTLRGGLFRSLNMLDRSFTEFSSETTPAGIADRFISAERDRRFGSWSGELRATRAAIEGPRLHQLHLSLRGRDQRRRYGGGQLVSLGRRPLDEPADVPEPAFALGPQTRDHVRQHTIGVGYEGRWRGVGELSVGVQKTDYRKNVDAPIGPLPVSRDKPWLFYANSSAHLSERLSLYAGYARGLEESPVAPSVARNPDEAPPAIITEQKDAGLRLVLPRDMRLVAGLFDVVKPYFGLDENLVFGPLGKVRHRGLELSLAGSPFDGLTAVLGTVFIDAELSGQPVALGLVGSRPVGTFVRYTNGALDYRIPFLPGLSFDIAVESTSARVADRLNRFFIPARSVASLGGRYRFNIGSAPASLRAQVANVGNVYGWANVSEGFASNGPRRFSLVLSADL